MAADQTPQAEPKFSEHELEVIHNLEKARRLYDLVHMPGWKDWCELRDIRLKQVKDQFFRARMDKEALWAAQIRVQGIEEFIEALWEGVDIAVESLNPDAIRGILERINLDPATIDGELGLPDLPDDLSFRP